MDYACEYGKKEALRRQELTLKGNKAYNKGLLKGLGFTGLWLYPLLKKPEK